MPSATNLPTWNGPRYTWGPQAEGKGPEHTYTVSATGKRQEHIAWQELMQQAGLATQGAIKWRGQAGKGLDNEWP